MPPVSRQPRTTSPDASANPLSLPGSGGSGWQCLEITPPASGRGGYSPLFFSPAMLRMNDKKTDPRAGD